MEENKVAILTIKGLPKLLTRRRYELAFWLRKLAKEIETEDPKIFASTFRARFILSKKK